MKSKEKVKGDFILIVVLVVIGLGTLVYNQVIAPRRGQGTMVAIEIEGQVVQRFDLSQNMAPRRFETEHGFNVVEINEGQVRVSEADCPDLLCVNTGWRRHVGQVIVCLPHYFVVRVVGEQTNPEDLDGFTY
ncbi:MAG: NusG domain II-containing protein [Bacillota bacterium]|jgi:hypothetical protein|nr:NusG domain II-containing protein [Bacillota bacterium]HHT91817.1 NusG domain II-containing protein [Bacillota bacterium]